jgi:type IV pilus assembly protein PilP
MKKQLTAVAAVVLLSGCSARGPEAPPRVVPRASEHAPVAAAVVPEPERVEASYQYSPVAKRDPFRWGVGCVPPPEPAARCAGPLCRYSLDELKLAGVISGMSRPVAVLENSRGKGYPVYVGTHVGRRGGVVKQVLRDAIVVAELWPDAQGGTHEAEVVLRMRADEPLALED